MEVLAPAKVNLGLSVLAKRPDSYHQIHTIFAALDIADRVFLEPAPRGIRLEVSGRALPPGPENLAYRAAQKYLKAAGMPGGVRLVLQKNLPVGAGLGGGSSDAAAVLKGLREIYPSGINLASLAVKLGADVPFFLQGGWAEAEGIGEQLSEIKGSRLSLVLAGPGLPVSTAAVYGALLPSEPAGPLPVPEILAALAQEQEPPYWNSLEAAAFRLYPQLAELKSELKKTGLRGVLMSGSGSCFFGIAGEEEARSIAQGLRKRYPSFWVQTAHTVVLQ
ncbi:MAG: 4-(cytidine 5'-diphospho)-2-C-methyl-D-erythritol kinase [Deinococcus sp.]|nr:4-(cytidine 5'-diphospho)-2-C-methyl-D-erythritol kinase [Deinococcus sp.]